jgi:hypothetical protein
VSSITRLRRSSWHSGQSGTRDPPLFVSAAGIVVSRPRRSGTGVDVIFCLSLSAEAISGRNELPLIRISHRTLLESRMDEQELVATGSLSPVLNGTFAVSRDGDDVRCSTYFAHRSLRLESRCTRRFAHGTKSKSKTASRCMALSDQAIIELLLLHLTQVERNHSAVYLSSTLTPAGTTLELPSVSLTIPWDALLAFVDREPLANWGHSCRYILVSPTTGETISQDGRFPPFNRSNLKPWRVIYQAPDVPDSALAVPK